MRKAFVSTSTVLLCFVGLFLLVQFLGAPVKSETLQRGIAYRPLADDGARLGAIQGQVVDRRGDPLRNVRVAVTTPERVERFRRLQLEGPKDVLVETRTDELGQFTLEGLQPGHARVWAGGERWLYAMTHVVEVHAGHTAHSIEVSVEPRPTAE